MMLRHAASTLVFIVVVFVGAPSASAQIRNRGEIRGQLRYSQGGAPAIDVVVRLDQLSGGAVNEARTDRMGRFSFSNLVRIQYHLIIRHIGYQEIQREVNLIMTSSEYLQLQLVSDDPKRSPVTVATKLLDANVPIEARREFEKGEALLGTGDKGKMGEAIRHFEKAIAFYPRFLEAQLKLGTTHMDLMQWPQAERVLRQAMQTHPGTPNLLFALGELQLQQRKFAEAEELLRDGLKIEPRSWQGHFTLGRLYWGNGDLVRAGRQVGFALQLNPTLAEGHLLAANIFLRARRIEEAEFEFDEYLRLAPKGKYAAETKEVIQKIRKARTEKR